MAVGLGAHFGPVYAYKRISVGRGLLMPVTAMLRMMVLMVMIIYVTFKVSAIAIYLGGRGIARGISSTRRAYRSRPQARPRTTQLFQWKQEKR